MSGRVNKYSIFGKIINIRMNVNILLLCCILSLLFQLKKIVAGFELTLIHDADTRGGIFEHDGDGDLCEMTDLNSTEAKIVETANTGATKCAGGASFRHTFFQNVRKNKTYPNPVIISKTKLFFGSELYSALSSTLNQTHAATHIAKYYTGPCFYDALSIDNSEFFSGPDAFGRYITNLPESTGVIDTYIDVNATDFSANQGQEVKAKVSKYKVVTHTDYPVAIMASADFQIRYKSNAGLSIVNNYDEPNKDKKGCIPCTNSFLLELSTKIKKQWVEIKQSYPNCKVLIFISSLTRDANKVLAKYVEEIDVIVGSGSDKPVEYVMNDISSRNVSLINSVWRDKLGDKDDTQEHGRSAGVFKISFDGNGYLFDNITVENVLLNANSSNIGRDGSSLSQMTNDYKFMKGWESGTLTQLSIDINGYDGKKFNGQNFFQNDGCRASDCEMGRLVTSAYLHACKSRTNAPCDVAIVNAGSIRGSFSKNTDVTNLDVARATPFDDNLVRATVSGSFLRSWIEHSLYKWDESAGTKEGGGDVSGKFLQTQGLRFVWNPYEGKILNIFVQSEKTWSLLKDDAEYKIIVSEFIGLRGGDGFSNLPADSKVSQIDTRLQVSFSNYLKTLSKDFSFKSFVDSTECLGAKTSDRLLRMQKGCSSMRTNQTKLYQVPTSINIALMLPNSQTSRGINLIALFNYTIELLNNQTAKQSKPPPPLRLTIHNTNGNSTKANSILQNLKSYTDASSAVILIGPLLSKVADGTDDPALTEGIVKHAITDILSTRFTQKIEIPIFTMTFGASDDSCNDDKAKNSKCSLTGGGSLFRRVCYTEMARYRALHDLILKQNWAGSLRLIEKGSLMTGEEPVSDTLISKINLKTFPIMKKYKKNDVSTLCDEGKNRDNVFILGLEDQDIKLFLKDVSSNSRCNFLFSHTHDKYNNVFLLLSSSGINYFKTMSLSNKVYTVAIGRYEPKFLKILSNSNVDMAMVSNITTDETLINAYESIVYASQVAKSVTDLEKGFNDIKYIVGDTKFKQGIEKVKTFLDSNHELQFDLENGNRVAKLELITPGPKIEGYWTASKGLLCDSCPEAFKDNSQRGRSSNLNNSTFFIAMVVVISISTCAIAGLLLKWWNLHDIVFNSANAWKIDADEIQLSKMIGKGAYGSVWRGTYNSTTVAIKTFENSGQISTENFIAEFVKLIDLRHKHLTQFVGAVLETRAIITDFMERGDLTNVLFDDSRHITGGEKIEWALHIALGLEYLHSKHVVHCDMKTANILVDKNYICKIADFGLSTFKNKKKAGRASDSFKKNLVSMVRGSAKDVFGEGPKGTALWLPPEVIRGGDYELAGDVFAYGLIISELINRVENFSKNRETMNQYKITTMVEKENLRPIWVDNVPDEEVLDGLKDVAEMCWKDDKNKRLTLPEICKCLTELSGRPRHSTVQSGVSQGVSTSDIEMVRQRSSDVMMGVVDEYLYSNIIDKKKWYISNHKQLEKQSKAGGTVPSYHVLKPNNNTTHFPKFATLCQNMKFRLGKKSKKIKQNMRLITKQIETLSSLNHPNMLEFAGISLTAEFDGGMVFFKLPGETYDLNTYMNIKNHVCRFDSARETLHGFLEICSAIAYLHKLDIVHGNISCYSILATDLGKLFLSRIEDRVISKNVSQKHDGLVTDAKGFLPPEALILDHFVRSSDIYSLGILMWYFLTKCVPFKDKSISEVNRQVVNDNLRPKLTIKDVTNANKYDKNSKFSYIDLMQQCWEQKLEDRISLQELVSTINDFVETKSKSIIVKDDTDAAADDEKEKTMMI